MPTITSRVNGLKINIPQDARGVIHRFAIGGGGNELIFEPIKRSEFNASKQADSKPVTIGEPSRAPEDTQTTKVELSTNVVDDTDANDSAATDRPTRRRRRKEPDPEI